VTPRVGDWAVVHTSGKYARPIQAFTGSEWNHAIVYVGNGLIIEAAPGGVRLAKLSKYDGCPILWSSVDLTDEQRDTIRREAMMLRGIPYSYLDIAALGLSCAGIIPLVVFDRLDRPDRLICSQLVVVVYRKAGIILFTDKADCRVTPGDLADLTMHLPVPENR
jgi:hypothetical protein